MRDNKEGEGADINLFFPFLGLDSAGFRLRPGLLVGVVIPFLCPLFPFLVGGVGADFDPLRVRFAGGSSSSSSASSSPPSSVSAAIIMCEYK